MRILQSSNDGQSVPGKNRRLLRLFSRDDNGTAAIEFAILAIPFFLLVFAIIETCVAFAAEQTVNHAVNKLGRELRTGQITFAAGAPTDITETEFQTRFCEEISIMISCGDAVDTTLFLDLRSFNRFADIPTGIPIKNGRIDASEFEFNPGGRSTINVFRAYYLRRVVTDLMRPYLGNVTAGSDATPNHYLIVATTAYRNEAYQP